MHLDRNGFGNENENDDDDDDNDDDDHHGPTRPPSGPTRP